MNSVVTIAMANNAALLLVLSVVHELISLIPSKYKRYLPYISGLLISAICVVIMLMSHHLQAGIFFDTRSILISVTALTFGPIPTAVVAVAAALVRVSIAVAGQNFTGVPAGLAVIASSALIGLAWRYWLFPRTPRWRWLNVYAMGVTVHIVMLGCMLLLPASAARDTIRTIAAPVMVIYPIATVLLSMLLLNQQKNQRVQERLKESEERFQLLFNKAPLGYQSLDADGRFIDVNQQWLDTLGYVREEVIGKWFGDFLAPAYRDAFRLRFPVFKAQGHIHSEFEMVRKDGCPVFIAFDGTIGYRADGEFLQTHCILTDVTERRVAENALRTSEENYRRLFETMAQGVVYQAPDGSIVAANTAAERILGLTLDQMQGRTSMDPGWQSIREDGSVVDGRDHPAMVALRTGRPVGPVIMGVYQPAIRDHVWLSITAIPLFRPGEPEPYQVYATFNDITAERKANENYQQLFHKMVDAFALHEVICDAQGAPVDYRFLSVNPAFERMTGLKAEDITGRTVLEILPGTEPVWIERYGRVALTGEPMEFEEYTASIDKYFEVSAYQPAPGQFACTFTDVTKRKLAEADARESLLRLQALLDNSPGPIVIMDRDGRCVEVSAAATKTAGLTREAMIGREIYPVLPAEVGSALLHGISVLKGGEQPVQLTAPMEMDGRQKWFEFRLFPIALSGNGSDLAGLIGIDITDRVLTEQALADSEHKYSSYIENAPDGVFVTDENGKYVDVNQAGAQITGYSREQLLGMTIQDITAPESMDDALHHFKKLLETGRMDAELQYRHRDGSTRWWTVNAVKLGDNRYLGFSMDITDRKKAEEGLVYLGYHDYLTGLHNRRYFDEEAARLNAAGALPLSIIMGDIDGLKLINDAFGHAEGDRLIVNTAALLRACARREDIVARTGGDEFSILLPRTDARGAAELFEKIRTACLAYNAGIPNDAFHINMSLGYATKENASDDFSRTIKTAEGFMYQRKLLVSRSSHSAILSSIKATMFEKSFETETHAERLVALARQIGGLLGVSQEDLDHLELLATLHDIGKVAISDQILNKPGKLSEEEWVEMRKHPEIGYRIAASTPDLMPIADYILSHHERWDGRGYPQQLAGEEIPLLSRIIAVVDAYDAMTKDRPYRKAMTSDEAIIEIRTNAGTQFDPGIAHLFLENVLKNI